uniref:Glutathione transferase n=1 Tax=Euplotes harpa TaxID=151035 RepID=A0A7S3JJA6_9SPIT|mmetsp:Transcript_43326/g.50899  ORF Transcript_43326/g.50899 Transcript_43326/m.50899 type:complete len:399 (+) Transcript_43326:44-1240(+)
MMKIYYSNPSNYLCNLVKVVAAFSGGEYELVKIADGDLENYKTTKNPTGLFPYLEVDGQGISESNAIIRYIARLNPDSGLYGKSLFQSAKIDEILDFFTCSFFKVTPAIYGLLGYRKITQTDYKEAVDKLKDALRYLETLLGDKEHFVGDSVTLADIRVAAGLVFPMRLLMDPGFLKAIPNIHNHFVRMTSSDKFLAVFGHSKVSKRPLKGNFAKEEKKKKEEEKKVAPPPKKEEKDVDPLDLLPPTSLNLNDFKFWFINHENREAAFDEFVESKLDRAGWSFWDLRYIKYKGEGEKLYKTNNLLNGFIQRAEHFNKHSYGVHMIYGEEPNLDIKGVWMWRGLEIPQAMIDHPQFEYYNTKKLDIDNPEDRAYIKDMWCAKDGPMKDGTIIQNWKYQK